MISEIQGYIVTYFSLVVYFSTSNIYNNSCVLIVSELKFRIESCLKETINKGDEIL